MESSGVITVRVKHGSLKCGDLDIECNYTNKVRQLKQMICDQSPMHPEIGDQRLIYAGHLLGDEQALKDVFANGEVSQSSYTVHLAYSRDVLGRFNQQNNSSSQSSSSTQSSERPTPAASASQPTTNPDIRNFSMPYPGQPQYQHIQMGINPEFIALHEYYVRQMMAYMMHWSQVSLQMVHPTGTLHTNIPSRPFVIPQPAPEEPAAAAAAAANPRNMDVQENVRINEVVNRGEDDEAPRDVLDWMYTLVRVALIFSVVYFYSNFTRFFLVVLFTALVMVFQRRQVALQAEQVAANQRQAHANAPPARPNPPANSQGTSSAEAGNAGEPDNQSSPNEGKQDTSVSNEEESGRPDVPTVPEDVNVGGGNNTEEPVASIVGETFEQRRSIRDITWTFLTTFFTSLIPDMPQNN